jgi:ATP-binding cassette subfamily B protein
LTNTEFIDNLTNIVGTIISFSILLFIDSTLLLYAFIGVLPTLFVQLKYGKNIYWVWDLNANNRREYFNRRGHFQGTVALIELKLYQSAQRFISEIKKIISTFDDELEQIEKNKVWWEIFALLTYLVFLGLSIWHIVNLAVNGELPIGQMLFAYTTYRAFNGTLSTFFRRIGTLTEYTNYAAYWFQILALEPKIQNTKNPHILEQKTRPPVIEFKNVWFRYDKNSESWAIRDLSLKIDSGQKVAIVGLSGAGKTTFIKLLCRVYDPEQGVILIDGVDLKEIDVFSWQKMLGVLFQDYTAYQFTVKEAIALGDPEKKIDEKEIIRSATMAKAHDFIERLPKKYDQLLWKGFQDGVDLSKGERQRMALARVLYRNSPITILDEPTASVDALSELDIFNTLEKLPSDKTVILISHRFSTVKNTDQIFVIEHGEIIEHGKHETLMKHKGKYAELYTLQKESYE